MWMEFNLSASQRQPSPILIVHNIMCSPMLNEYHTCLQEQLVAFNPSKKERKKLVAIICVTIMGSGVLYFLVKILFF